ncbi:MAG: diheme cytochrome c-553, partial [Candidatus Eisenbacteria bacterium]|nr:diheme cytochrome c-553 [Candidatus Eisenbacteria bacterium]
ETDLEPVPGRELSGHPAEMTAPPPALPTGPWFAVTTMTAWHGPWGTSYAVNLTPDDETGIGVWTEDAFLKAFETGLHMGVGRPILPPMPVQNYRQLPPEDLKAIFAYLKSLPPVRNAVPEPVMAAPPAGGGEPQGS